MHVNKITFYFLEIFVLLPPLLTFASIFTRAGLTPKLLPYSALAAFFLLLWTFFNVERHPKFARFAIASIIIGIALWLLLPSHSY